MERVYESYAEKGVDLYPNIIKKIENEGSSAEVNALHHVEKADAGAGTTCGMPDSGDAVKCSAHHKDLCKKPRAPRSQDSNRHMGAAEASIEYGAKRVDLYPRVLRDLENQDSERKLEALHHVEQCASEDY